MVSIKVKFRPSAVAAKEGTIFYQIRHGRQQCQLNTDYRIFPAEWDEPRGQIISRFDSSRAPLVSSIRSRIIYDVECIRKIAGRFDRGGVAYSPDDVVNHFICLSEEFSLFRYMESIIMHLIKMGRTRTSETYRAALNSFRKFRNGEDVMLQFISSDLMLDYESWLRSRGVSSNTVSFYNRILRAVYNRAVDDEIIENRRPFRKVYTGIGKTVKRALPVSDIRKIMSLDLSSKPKLRYARDMFMLSFYLRGMSLIDMSYLKKSDLRDGVIVYRRRKTGQLLSIAWTDEMQRVLDFYPENPTEYLLPIITSKSVNDRYRYRYCGYIINRSLRQVAAMAGIKSGVTLYVARHSWASAAKSMGIPLDVIREGMGHGSESTTRIYLAGLDASVVDSANSIVLNGLK